MLLKNIVKTFVIAFAVVMFVSCTSSKKTGKTLNLGDKEKREALKAEKREMEFTHYFIEGNKNKTLGYFPEAKAAFAKCLEIKPNSAAVNYEIANVYLYQNKFVEALDYSKKAAEINEGNIWYQLLYANLLLKNGERKRGLKIYNNLVDDYPKDKKLMLDLAGYYSIKEEDYKKAIKILDRVEKRFGVSEELFIQKEAIYSKKGQQDKIIMELEKLIVTYPNNINYIGIYAEYLMSVGRQEEAYEAYQNIFAIDPDNGLAHISIGKYYLNIGNSSKAMQEFTKGIKSDRIDILPKVDLVISLSKYFQKQISNDAIYSLVELICEVHPNETGGHALKAEYLIKKKRYSEAREEVKIILKNDKKNYLVWQQLLQIDTELNDYIFLYQDSKQAIEYFPNYSNFFLYNGFACDYLKKYTEGIDMLEMGLDMTIGQPQLKLRFLSSLAELYYQNKNYKKSFKAFDQALEIAPNNEGITNNYSYYLALRNEDLDKAVRMSKKNVEQFPNNYTYLDTYAWVLYKSKSYSDALVYIKKAINNGGDKSAIIVEHYGDILYNLNKIHEAKTQWEKAQKLGNGTKYLEQKIKKGELIEE